MIAEKIALVESLKNNILDIYSAGQRVHQVMNICNSSSCTCLSYLSSLSTLLENIKGQKTTSEEQLLFHHLSLKNMNSFLLYDQINKKFSEELHVLDDKIFKLAIDFEIEKIKRLFKKVEDIKKLEGTLYVFSKTFL